MLFGLKCLFTNCLRAFRVFHSRVVKPNITVDMLLKLHADVTFTENVANYFTAQHQTHINKLGVSFVT